MFVNNLFHNLWFALMPAMLLKLFVVDDAGCKKMHHIVIFVSQK